MDIWCTSSSTQVFKCTRKWPQDSDIFVLNSAKNMIASFQICLREVDADFDVNEVNFPTLPKGINVEYHFIDYITFNDGTHYPDIISNKTSVHVLLNTTQSIFICLQISEDTETGTYNLPINILTSIGQQSTTLNLTVYPLTLPDPKNSDFCHEYFFDPMIFISQKEENNLLMPIYYHYEKYSENFWALMMEFAKKSKELRINCLHIPIIRLLCDGGSKRVSKTEWQLNWNLFDKFVEFFLQNGSYKKLSISAIISSVSGKTISSINEEGSNTTLEIFTPEADAWAKTFYGGIYTHFKEKGWLHMLQMRLQDEPHSSEYWIWAREKCSEYMPGISCGEPLDTHSIARELINKCNQYIPRIEVYEEGSDYYLERQKAGDEVWCYSCCYPEKMGWMNKFIDLPTLYPRLMKWACFSHGITGFLHWGMHYWNSKLYGLDKDARFKGDGFIVYPDVKNNSILHSARGFATIDGLQDLELLLLLNKKNPNAAKAIAYRIAKSFTDLHSTTEDVDFARAQILTLLS